MATPKTETKTTTKQPAAQGPADQQPAAQGPADQGRKARALRVVSVPVTFRRAGLGFGREPTLIPEADLSAEQIAAILAEPNLSAEWVDAPAPAAE